MKLSPQDMATVRERPQSTRLDLFIYQPREIFRAQVNSTSITKGATSIPFDGATLATPYNIVNGTTMLVGKSDGGDDWGSIRIRSCSYGGNATGTFLVSENSNILWENDLYLTVLDYQDVVPVFPRIIQNPSNSEDVIFYKDYNIPYTNQNSVLGSVVNMGSHRARTLKNGSASIYWSATGTWNLDSSTMITYQWSFGGGTPTGSVSESPGLVSYDTPGDYVTSCTVTAGGTSSYTGYRYVAIRDEIGQGDYPPMVRWEVKNFAGSREEGGYSADFTVYDNMNISGNQLVMLVADDWYGNTNVSLGGNTDQEPYMFFVGYIDKDSIRYDYKTSKVEFTATSITGLMKNAVGFSVSVESKKTPKTWYELYEMDCKRAIYHYLRWHSTVLNTTDYYFNGEDKLIQFFDADRTSMFDSIDELMRSALVGNVCSDRQGRLYAEIEPRAYDNPTGTFSNYVMDITRRDWIDEPQIEERINNDVSYMERGGIKYKGVTTGIFQALLACAPGITPSFRGEPNKEQGLALKSQTQLNALIGHLYANANSKFPNISLDMSANYRNLDIAPFETTNITIQKEDTVRNKYIQGLYIPSSMTWKYNHRDGLHLPSVEFKELVNGFPGDTIIIPPVDTGSPNFPMIDFTPLAIPPTLPYASGSYPADTDPTTVVLGSLGHGVLYTTNFDEIAPVWQTMNVGLPTGTLSTLGIGNIVVCPNLSLFMMCDGDPTFGYNSLYYAPAVGEPWELVMDGMSTGNVFKSLASNPTVDEEVAMVGGGIGHGADRFLVGDHIGLVNVLTYNAHCHVYQTALSFGDGAWRVVKETTAGYGFNPCQFSQSMYGIYGSGGSILGSYWSTTVPPFPNNGITPWFSNSNAGRDSDKIICWIGNGQYVVIDGTTFTQKSDLYFNGYQSVAASPTGNNVLAGSYDFGAGFYLTYRSKDGGNTWELASGAVPSVNDIYENCGDEKRWIFGGGGGIAGGVQVKYTSNFIEPGFNENKEGNLTPNFTGIHLTHIRFVA